MSPITPVILGVSVALDTADFSILVYNVSKTWVGISGSVLNSFYFNKIDIFV